MNLTSNDISYLRQKASEKGYNADDLLKVINYESSGRPDVWGGKNDQYYGLIQFGPNERKQFGIDTVHPSATNQIDGAFKFLEARGFKPGMGLPDMYSTVNAGSPGHYKAYDGNGTVMSHVAAMQGMKPVQSSSEPKSALPMDIAPALSSEKKTDPIADLIAAGYDPQKMKTQAAMNEIGDYGAGLLKQAYQPAQMLSPAPMAPMQMMNAPIPQANRFKRSRIRGLLG
jgi:hypothetical protein